MSPSFSKRGPVATRSAASLSASVTRALSEAAERARDRVAAGDRGASSASELLLLRETILGLAGGSDEMPRREELHLFSRRAIDTLRFEFLAGLRDGAARRISSRELVAVLTAMDAIEGPAEQENRADGDGRHANAEALNGMLEIAHDMRSPLGAILLLVDPLRRGRQGPVTPVQERQLGLIYGAALSLSTLANDIIDAARGDAPPIAAAHPFSVSETIQDACAVVSPIAEEKGLTLSQTYPSTDGRIGDSALLHRVLLNLASNALKYTEQGSVAVGCTELDRTRVEFWVKDTGPGIPDDVVAKLFQEFQVGSAGRRFSSAGLGLSICRRLLASMHSSLCVNTVLGHGTRFSFVLELPRA